MISKFKTVNESQTIIQEIEKKLNGMQVQIDDLNKKNKSLHDFFSMFYMR